MLFSIIIPTYNRAAFIAKAVDSVMNQSYQHWELIIIDDASIDNTQACLKSYNDPRIKVYRNEVNIERSASRNKGIKYAKGEYICFLDSDDYFLPNHLESLALGIANAKQQIALFHTGVKQFISIENKTRIIERTQGVNPVESVLACNIPVITVAIHASILKKFRFEESMRINEDVFLFAQIASKYPLVYIPEVSVVWVLHGNNTANQEYDYLSPQLWALKRMEQDSTISPFLSTNFIKERKFNLYTQLIFLNALKEKHVYSTAFFVKGFLLFPLKKQNWTNFLNVIYHLPGGFLFKNMIRFIKK